MKKMDLHIHTVSTKRDKPFAFSIEKLKGYVIQEKVDLIAITNHNLFDAQQFSDITNALPIKVFPGIEVDIEGGHLIVITDPSDIDDFTEKCAKVYRLNETSEDSYISEAQFMEIFNDLGKYILIPHYEKEPKLPLERVPQISPYIKCGEACSAKKFIYMQSRSEKLVPVLFSDWRVEEKAQFPLGRQTYIDIDDVNMMSLKYALTDKAKVSLKPEDGNSLFQILDNGLQISTGLTVLLGKRSSGKTYTLDQINAQFPGGKYIKQFSLLSTDDEQSQRKFEAALKNRGNSVTESYLGPFKTVVDDVQSVNLEQDAKEIDEYLETLKKAGEDAQRQDIFSKANLYQESNFSIKNLSSLVEMIEAVETLLGSIEYKELVEKYVGRRSLLRLAIALREQYIQEKTDSLHKEYVNSLITSVKKELSVRSSTTAVPDIDLYQILMNQHKVQVFHDVVKMIKKPRVIQAQNLYSYRVVAQSSPFSGALAMQKVSRSKTVFSDAFKEYNDPYKFLQVLKGKDIPASEYYKYFVNITYEVFNQYGSPASGGERSEYNLLQELSDGVKNSILILDEPESSFDNIFLRDGVDSLLKDISKTIPVIIATHNNTIGVSVHPDYIVYACKEVLSDGKLEYHLYSGYPSSEDLVDLKGNHNLTVYLHEIEEREGITILGQINDSLIDDNSPAPSGGFGNPFNDPNWEQHITSFFGKREDVGIPGKDTTNHNGLDIAYPYGTPILAVEAGTVIKAGYHVSYGNYLVINHGGGYCTLYAHCSQLLAQVGDTVNKYDTIAKVGATGDVTGNHLHICVIIDGVYVNPKGYLH